MTHAINEGDVAQLLHDRRHHGLQGGRIGALDDNILRARDEGRRHGDDGVQAFRDGPIAVEIPVVVDPTPKSAALKFVYEVGKVVLGQPSRLL